MSAPPLRRAPPAAEPASLLQMGVPAIPSGEEGAPVGTVRERTSRVSQVVTLIAVVVPPLGIVSAMGLLWGVGFHVVDALLFLGLYTICAFGTTIGFHRYFTHKGFEAKAPVKAA